MLYDVINSKPYADSFETTDLSQPWVDSRQDYLHVT